MIFTETAPEKEAKEGRGSFPDYCLQQNATEEDIKQHNVNLAAISRMVEWLKVGQEPLTKSLQQVSS